MDVQYLIIPGYGNSDDSHWQTFFEKKLPNCRRIHQKSWDKPLCTDWVNTIDEAVSQYTLSSVVLISHSMGGIAIAHWVKKFSRKIRGALLVAPPDLDNPYLDLSLESFTPTPLIQFPFPSILVASTNDNWANVERSQFFSENWGSEICFLPDAGHINTTSGFGDWEEGLDILKRL